MTSRKFFQILILILVSLLSTNVFARDRIIGPDRMRTTWGWQARYEFRPAPVTILQPCADNLQLGFNVWTGLAIQTNMMLPASPVIGADLEFCVKRYSDADWAPSRVAIGFLAGTNKINETWLLSKGVNARYQIPIVETIDIGLDLKYNQLNDLSFGKKEEHHDLICSVLGEFRPGYSAYETNKWSGIYLTARIGMGTGYNARTQQYRLISEILFNIGYRFAHF